MAFLIIIHYDFLDYEDKYFSPKYLPKVLKKDYSYVIRLR